MENEESGAEDLHTLKSQLAAAAAAATAAAGGGAAAAAAAAEAPVLIQFKCICTLAPRLTTRYYHDN